MSTGNLKANLKLFVTGAGGPAAVSFMRSLAGHGIDFYAGDLDPHAAGLYLVPEDRRFLLPRGASPEFLPAVVELCREHKIDVLVPTVDCELLPVAEAIHQFDAINTKVLLTSAASLRLSLDKLETLRACEGVVPVPRFAVFDKNFDPAGWEFPLFIKPRSASGSRGILKVNSAAQLAKLDRSESLLVQEYLPGEEYSVDVFSTADEVAQVAVPESA